jgi:CHAT domain
MRIARKTLAGPGTEGLEFHMRELAKWHAEKDRLEVDLARRIPELNLEQKLRAADQRAVALNLPEGVVLIEFVRFPVFDFQSVPARGESEWKSARYVAFVLAGAGSDDVRMLDLGAAEPIDRLIAHFRAGIIADGKRADGRDMAKQREESPLTAENDAALALRAALFDPIALVLGDLTRLLIAPDGDLARLPFEVLPTADGHRLIDAYQISYLSCGRDVLRLGAAISGEAGVPLVVADPDFDLNTVALRKMAQPRAGLLSRVLGRGKQAMTLPDQSPRATAMTASAGGRHSRDVDRTCGDYHFHRLPGTREEGNHIANLLNVSPWLDATALEGRLKTACRSPRILHLATHGFFLPTRSAISSTKAGASASISATSPVRGMEWPDSQDH